MKRSTPWILLPSLALMLAACSSEKTAQQQPSVPAINAQTTAPATSPAPGADLAGINVCEKVPSELIAEILGATVLKPSQRSDYGSNQGCEYQIDPAGSDTYEYLAIWIGPPAQFSSLEETLGTAHGLKQDATGETVDGLGDQAFTVHNMTEHQEEIFVLVKDKMSVEVKAEQAEHARKLAQLVLSNL